MAELERLGVRSVPVLSRGDKYTFGQSTKQIGRASCRERVYLCV